ncbi:MAG TPA: DNRLRE domain-containing protein, partial [Candidatus Limnocylindrales bacterium]
MTRARATIYVSVTALVVLLTALLPTATSASTTITLTPVADAHVAVAAPNNNYGATTPIRTREGGGTSSDPTYRSYLKFDVSGLAGQTIESVTLRLFATDASPNAQGVFNVANSGWIESTITNANAPAPDASPLASVAVPLAGYNDIPLPTTAITGTQFQTYFIRSAGNNNFAFNAKESATNRPQLVVV